MWGFAHLATLVNLCRVRRSQFSSLSQRSSVELKSGICAGRSRSSTLTLANYVFTDLGNHAGICLGSLVPMNISDKHWSFLLQGAYAGFAYTYAVLPPMSLNAKTAGYLPCIFWASVTGGRLLSIPLSYRIRPMYLLVFSLVNVLI